MKKNITNILLALAIVIGLVNYFKPAQTVKTDFVVASFNQQAQVNEYEYDAGETLRNVCLSGFVFPPTHIKRDGVKIVSFDATCSETAVTSTPAPSATATDTATATEHAHETATPSETPVVGALKCAGDSEHWHAPGAHDGYNAHEHGQAPPQWAIDFGRQFLGEEYPCFGGPENTGGMENTDKHVGYKCVSFTLNRVEYYLCFHMTTNPMDRAFAFHSYRIYIKDAAGNISYRTGWIWYGYPEFISQRMCRFEDAGRDQFVMEGVCPEDWDNFQRNEQWYGLGPGIEVSLTRGGATTFFHHGEHEGDFHDMTTWDRTGALGLDYLRLELTVHIRGSGNIPNTPVDRWYCVVKHPTEDRRESYRDANGKIRFVRPKWSALVPSVSSPSACPDGYLPQYTASTYQGVNFQTPGGNTRVWNDADIPGEGIVEFPN